MAFWNKFESVNTSVAGVMSGPEAESRQYALSLLADEVAKRAALPAKERRIFFDLVPEWTNLYDPDALQVMADVPGMGRVQLGYVRNSDTTCDFCGHMMERYPTASKGKPACCKKCGRTDHLRRDGLATKVSSAMREDPHSRFYGEVLAVTGGVDDKCYGCNFVIRQVVSQKPRAKVAQ